MSMRASELPRTLRVAANARRLLGERGTRAVYGSAIARPLRRLLASAAPEGPVLTQICGGALRGMRMHIDLTCEKYYWLGTHEEPVQRALGSQARAGAVAYDIGAHAGFFTLLLSRLVGEEGSVLAFEPHPDNAARLARTVEANSCRNVVARRIALSDRTGDARFAPHASTLEGALASTGNAGIAVTTSTIDDLVRDGALPPDLMKIDVEGAEGRVISGGGETIAAWRPRLVVEIHSAQAWREVIDALPVPYTFTNLEAGGAAPEARIPGHYLGIAAGDRS